MLAFPPEHIGQPHRRRTKQNVHEVRPREHGLAGHDAQAVIIRPDRFVAGTAKTESDLGALTLRLAQAVGCPA